MIWPAITSLMDSNSFIPDPPYPMDPTPPPPPAPFARAAKAKVLHEVSHKDDDVIDTPEIQGEEE
jgi:hypothetical protein